MAKLSIDFDEVQKAMEDITREAFDYFLDLETGEVMIISEDILLKARSLLSEHMEEDIAEFDGVELDEEQEIPEWMEDEIELALEIFLHEGTQYSRIPERNSGKVFAAMKEFAETLEDDDLRGDLEGILDGKGVFRIFKNTLENYPKEKKNWYGFNARSARNEIEGWLRSIGVEPVSRKAAISD